MVQRYRLNNGRIKQPNVMGLGFAPGGYVEVFLTNPNNWYDCTDLVITCNRPPDRQG
ncbi:DUF2931 family protein [Aeromonas veronii]|nr:DUF2931 family protein [Aeromonas veronii]